MNTISLKAGNEKANSIPNDRTLTVNFFDFLLQNNRLIILLVLLTLIQILIFKIFYPYPSFFSDSYAYIVAARSHLNVSIWPIGYSWFLSTFHHVTHSPTILIFFQHLFLELTALYFYQTTVYLFSPGKITRIILIMFFFFNPLNLYLSNFVSSDSLFTALSLLWLTEALWTIYRPNLYHLIGLSAACIVAFTFRYNAMIYPLVGLPIFLLARKNMVFKLVGIFLGPILVLSFIIFSSMAAKQISGTAQFPPILGGWQWANNALYMREFIVEDSTQFPDPQMGEIDALAREFYRAVPPQNRDLPPYIGNYFIRESAAPLKQFMGRHYGDTIHDQIKAWAKVAPIFKNYGLYLIKRHPAAFLQHYILINTKNYFIPPLEKLEIYNQGVHYIWPVASHWFNYPSTNVTAVSLTLQGYILKPYPTLFLLLNLFFACNLVIFLRRRGFLRSERRFAFAMGTLSTLILLNAAFSIFANIIVFRYQVFPMFLLLIACILLVEKNRAIRVALSKS